MEFEKMCAIGLEKAKNRANTLSLKNKNSKIYLVGNEHRSDFEEYKDNLPYIDDELGFYLVDVYFMNGEEYDI